MATTTTSTIRTTSRTYASSEAANYFLQKNHDEHHIFWREVAGHNHIAHSVLSIFALGGSPEDIQRAFDDGAEIQRAQPPRQPQVVEQLSDANEFRKRMGNLDEYPNFLAYFENQISEKGWVQVLQENLFSGTPNSETIFANLLEGLYHPLIHVGLGIEFAQPSVIAEGLAQAASHDSMAIETFLRQSEKKAEKSKRSARPLIELYDAVRTNDAIRTAAQGFTDAPSRIRDGIIARSATQMIEVASQYRVDQEQLQRALAETTNVSALAVGAIRKPGKAHKIDFFHMHGVTASIFLKVFVEQPWISTKDKVRLVERKGRVDLLWYAASGSVELSHDLIPNYKPNVSAGFGWEELNKAVLKEHDDGHLAKLVRALRIGQEMSREFELGDTAKAFPVKDDEWLKIAQLAYDSTSNRPIEQKWVWGAGFDECWGLIPSKP